MDFPDSVVLQVWNRAGGHCECTRTTHGHLGRCNQSLVLSYRGREVTGGWEAHHIVSVEAGGKDVLSNCDILCIQCHKLTRTYGR